MYTADEKSSAVIINPKKRLPIITFLHVIGCGETKKLHELFIFAVKFRLIMCFIKTKYAILLRVVMILPIFGLPLSLQAKLEQEQKEIKAYSAEKLAFFDEWWQNPALNFFYPLTTCAEVAFGLKILERQATLVQDGKKYNNFSFNASSLTRQKDQLYYGDAGYENLIQRGILWNTTADWHRVSPYVVADTIGGTVYQEQYAFRGGYARNFGVVDLGLEASYRAKTMYKINDPRPKNTVSDMRIAIGGAYRVGRYYAIGVETVLNTYQQDQYIKVYKEDSGVKIFYLRGFGIADEMFSTVLTSSGSMSNTYEQTRYEARLTLFPMLQNGWFALVGRRYGDLFLKETRLNDVCAYEETRTRFAFGYLCTQPQSAYAVKVSGLFGLKQGTEYAYSRGTEFLNKALKFEENVYQLGLDFIGYWQWREGLESTLIVKLFFEDDKQEYLGLRQVPVNAMNWTFGYLKGQKNTRYKFSLSSLLLKISAEYKHNLSKSLQAGVLSAPTALETLVYPDYRFLTANQWQVGLSARYDYDFNPTYGIFFEMSMTYAHYKSLGNARSYFCSLGITL